MFNLFKNPAISRRCFGSTHSERLNGPKRTDNFFNFKMDEYSSGGVSSMTRFLIIKNEKKTMACKPERVSVVIVSFFRVLSLFIQSFLMRCRDCIVFGKLLRLRIMIIVITTCESYTWTHVKAIDTYLKKNLIESEDIYFSAWNSIVASNSYFGNGYS